MTHEDSEQLIAQLQADELAVRYRAAFELLKQNRTEAIEVIVEYLNQRPFQYLNSYAVVDQLAAVDDERVVDALIGILELPAHVVGNALRSLLTIGTKRSVQAVFDMLMSPSPWMGWGTANLIAEHGARFLVQLLEASHHENPLMRARSIYALGVIAANQENTAIQDRLVVALKDEDAKVRERAAWGLAHLSSDAVHTALMNVLESEDVEGAQWAAEGLYRADVQKERSLSILIQSLSHDDWLVRRNAVWALQRLGDKRAVPALIDALQNDVMRALRFYAAEALAALNDTRAVQALQTSLSDKDEMVRAACVKALAELAGPDVLSQLVDLLFDTDMLVQEAVIQVWQKHKYHPKLE